MKIQKIPWGSPSPDPPGSLLFAARLGNRLVFILDPRLVRVLWCIVRQGMLEERINCTLSSLLKELAEEE